MPRLDRVVPALYALTIFCGAFLVFLVEPIVAKALLPWFGGAASVWATCLMFFQVSLLLGYVYADQLVRRLAPRAQVIVQLLLVSGGAMLLPIIPSPRWKPFGTENPALLTLGALASTVGIPFVLMAATGPLVQVWYSRRYPHRSPYRLFALSNAASILALLLYPAALEPWIGTRSQSRLWSGAYLLWAVLMVVCATAASTRVDTHASVRQSRERADPDAAPPRAADHFKWIGLAALGSVLLVAVTNYMTRDIAAIPLLWVVPLVVYLLTFVIAFQEHRWLTPGALLGSGAAAPLLYAAFTAMSEYERIPLPIWVQLGTACLVLLSACLFCHGRIAQTKPAPRYLTRYYLMIALGGALGAMLVGLAAPALLPVDFDWQIAMALCAATVLGSAWRRGWGPALLSAGALSAVLYADTMVIRGFYADTVLTRRNFYGSLRLTEWDADAKGIERSLNNGITLHGTQYTAPDLVGRPTTYYGPTSGVGRALLRLQRLPGPHRIGVVGLGAGTLAAYGREGDLIRFYEINPAVVEIARREFSYVRDSAASVDIVPGDARLSLEREPPQHFDLLAVDAFTSDSIPVHLLTSEAIDVYLMHLQPDGVLAVHTTNRYVALTSVIERLTAAHGLEARLIEDRGEDTDLDAPNAWVLVARRVEYFDAAEIKTAAQPLHAGAARLWTDDYSNLLQSMLW
jgi:hypothetical protein